MHSKTLMLLREISNSVLKSIAIYLVAVVGLFGFYLGAGWYIVLDVKTVVDDPFLYTFLLGFGFGGSAVACFATLLRFDWFQTHVQRGEAFFSTIHYPILERRDQE